MPAQPRDMPVELINRVNGLAQRGVMYDAVTKTKIKPTR